MLIYFFLAGFFLGETLLGTVFFLVEVLDLRLVNAGDFCPDLSSEAFMKPMNRGCGSKGRDLNSG